MPDTQIPIRVKFWLEDDVWNGVAEDLPVAVFGTTLDEAWSRLRAAIEDHMHVAVDVGTADELVQHLRDVAVGQHVVEDADVGALLGRQWFPLPTPSGDVHA